MPLQTFVDIQNEVLNFGFNDGPQVNRNRVKNWINEAQWELAAGVEAPEFQVNFAITLIPGQYIYPLPSDFLRAQDVAYPNMNTRLRPVDIQDFDMANVANVNGPPATYTLDQTNMYVFPNPSNTGDVITLRYIQQPATLVNDTDIPQINPRYLYLLKDYAVVRGFEAEDDYEAAQYWTTRYNAGLAKYQADVQWRHVDRPRQVDGTWSYGSVSRSEW